MKNANPVKVFFDISTLRPEKVTGIGLYMLHLIKYLHHLPSEQVQVQPLLKVSHWRRATVVQQKLQSFVNAGSKDGASALVKKGSLTPLPDLQIFKPWRFSVPAHSIYHGPDFRLSLWAPGLPRVLTIHDMLVFANKFSDSAFDRQGQKDITQLLRQKKPQAVITNSQFTNAEILKYFPEYEGKLFATAVGCQRLQGIARESSRKDLPIPEKYFFFLGTLELRKNLLGIIKSFALFRARVGQEKLVLGGFWGHGEEQIRQAIAQSPVQEHIVLLNALSDADCRRLYEQATAFFFPSLYEGFGVPVLEAMGLGCPVVTSSAAALPEIAGGAALLADPDDYAQLAQHLWEVSTNPSLRATLVSKGLRRSQDFSWQECALQTLAVYEKVLNDGR